MRMVLDGAEPMDFPEVSEEALEPYLEPPVTTVPSLVGLEESAAVQLATQADLNPRVQDIASLEPPGRVVHQSLRPGATVEAGIPITIYVSNGEVPSGNLPQVRGRTLEEAESIFDRFFRETGVLLNVVVVYVEVSDPHEVGRVQRQTPARGTPVGYLETVTLEVGESP